MGIDELRWFLVLAETQNATRAAEMLNITQPTLSRALRRLERQVGAPLFDRSRQRLHLNSHGEVFRIHAQRAVREIASATDTIATQLGPAPGSIRLSFLHSFGAWLVPDLLGAFSQIDPQTRFVLHQDSADEVLVALQKGRADLILTSPRPTDPMVEWLAMRDEQLVLAVPLHHHLAGRPVVYIRDLAEEGLVTMQSEFGLRQTTQRLFRQRGLTPKIVMESADITTIRGLVARGLGVAIVPGGPHVPHSEDYAVIELADDDAYRSIGLCWYAGRDESQAVRRFRRFVEQRIRDSQECSAIGVDTPAV